MLANDHAIKIALDAIADGDAGPVFLISVFGLTSLLRAVLKHVANLDVNQKNKHGHTPIYLAAALGHSATLSLLVDHGADVNVQCGKYGSPLHAACFAGHLEAVKALLKLDANMSCGAVFDDAFQAACRGGQEGVALLLIDSSVVKSENDYEKVLEGAARAGFVDVVENLQAPPFMFFINSKPDQVRKKTRKAIQGGQLGVIRQFLDQQTNRRDVLPLDGIALATLYNHRLLVEFLLDEGLSVHAEGAFGTPLRTACLLNYQPIARLLLDRGADVNACGAFGDSLQAAAMKGHTKIVKLITDEGANVNQQSGFYGTALQAAAYHGHHDTVEFLLDAGAHVHAKGYSKDAFHAAAEGGRQDVIMLMLRKGYNIFPPFSFFSHPPQASRSQALRHKAPYKAPYKVLMRDASPGRVADPYRQRESFQVSKVVSAKATRPITELEAIFRRAEQDPEMIRVQSEEVPTAGYIPRSYVQHRRNYPLEAAASAGQEASVKVLLEQREVLGIPEDEITDAIKVAASNSHGPVVQLLLDDVAKRQPVKPHIESILEVLRQRQNSPIVGLALAQATKYCSADEVFGIKQNLAADKRDYDPEVGQETLISDFEKGCKLGDVQVIDAILASKKQKKLSPSKIDAGLQLCVLNGQTTVVKLLCESPSLKGRLPTSGEEALVVAAGNGSVDMIRLLTSYWTAELTKADSVTVIHALVVASGNGHIDVVRYLVQDMSADINTLAPDRPVGSGLNESWSTRFPFAVARNAFKIAPVISPLHAALRGFSKFNPSRDRYGPMSFNWENALRKAEKSQHEEVIVFLINNGSKLNDLGGQSKFPIQMAVESCPTHIVEKFISTGTNINATVDGKSALFAAAGRELSSASIVRRLLAAGATIPKKVEEQEELLDQALHYFKGDTLREYFHDCDDPDGHFLEAPSLEYVFNEGSGAVLFDLLHLMPQITATDVRWNLVLQMAALLNNHLFLDLLLSRGTDVNTTGYYGTALQAAARCGHISMVRKLLDAGAQVNVIKGRWQTALRAAIVGGHAEIAETLLNHGADMELRLTRQRLYSNDLEKASDNALQLGVKSGSLKTVKTLLKHGANAVHDEIETMHPLILASQQGSVVTVKELLDAGAPINIPGKKDSSYKKVQAEDASPMHAAVASGYLDLIKLLLSHGADLENNVEGCGTPLRVAASKSRADIVRLLLSAGANAADGAALYDAVREGSIEIAQELLAAGSKAEPVLALACRRGLLPMIEILLEKVYDGERPDIVIDEVFAIHELDHSVFRLLLDYANPTMKRFVHVCAAGSVASVKGMLDKGGIDINGQTEPDGDYPLQVAALHLQAEVVRLLLTSGAIVNCKSAQHGTPLITSLEACAASTLRRLKSEKPKDLIDRLCLRGSVPMRYRQFYTSGLSSFQQISSCEHIVQLLLIHGANIVNDDRPFGSPMHLACLLGNKGLVELLLEKGADLNTTAGFFEKTIFAAIQGGHPDVVELVLEKAPLTKHIHSEYATPLHLACTNEFSAAVRKLLEHGADATVLDAKGRTPLTIALEKKKMPERASLDPRSPLTLANEKKEDARACEP